MTKFFVTGTDTEVGKTFASCALLRAANNKGLKTLALKPVAAGCEETSEGLRNEDGLALLQEMSVKLSYDQVNPIKLRAATSPHIAAAQEKSVVSVSRLLGFCRGAMMNKADLTLVEGAGGWRVPLNPRETLADLAKQLDFPVILVVSLKLGCLNHALLTVEAIRRDGLTLAGWVANRTGSEAMGYEREYMDSLRAGLQAPLIADLPFVADSNLDLAANSVDLSCLNL